MRWLGHKDGVPPITDGMVRLTNGSATVIGSLDEPGFLHCRAVFRGTSDPTRTAVAGAAIDPLQIKPSLPVPADFDAFWAAQKKKLAAVPINARLIPVKSTSTNVECFDLQAESLGAPVSGYYARPVGARPGSLPIILTVHGASVRSASLSGAAGWANKGMLALDLNAHGLPNGQAEGYYTNLANADLKDYRTRGRESRETMYFLGMFLRLVRAIDFLTTQPKQIFDDPPSTHTVSAKASAAMRVTILAHIGQHRQARTFYVDAVHGDDTQDGFKPERAWRSLAAVNRMTWALNSLSLAIN